MSDKPLGLAEAIEAVRRELNTAQKAGQDAGVRFNVGTVEIDLSVEVTKTGGGEVSVKVLNVVSIGGKGEGSHAETNRVKVILTPIAADGEAFEVGSVQSVRPDASG